jgi:hypothetical protein
MRGFRRGARDEAVNSIAPHNPADLAYEGRQPRNRDGVGDDDTRQQPSRRLLRPEVAGPVAISTSEELPERAGAAEVVSADDAFL